MDEFNKNTSSDNNEQEQRTPFQTPVRGASGGGTQNGGTSQQGNPYSQTNGGGTAGDTGSTTGNPYGQSTQSGTTGNPYHQGTQSGASGNPYSQRAQSGSTGNPYQQGSTGGSNPYRQWGTSSGSGKGPQKKNNKGPKVAVLAVIIAVVAFVGGMAAGGGLNLDRFTDENAEKTTTESGSGLPADSTKVQISQTQNTGKGEESDDGLTSTEIYKTVSPSIVSIVVDDITVGSEASGSGVIMSNDGYIITNDHVVEGGNKFTVITSDNTQYQAELVGTDSQTDLAVLKISTKDKLTVAEFGKSDELTVGDRCYAIGSPGGVEFQNSFTGGFVSAIDRDVTINDRVMTLIQTDAAINPGSSGGALINKYGQVVGITSSKLSSSSSSDASFEGMGFAIPMSTAEDIVNELIAYGHVTGRPAIGISGYDIDETMAKYYDVPQGVLVSSVDQASDAYKQGVQANDIITAVNGKTISTMSDINKIKEKCKAGDEMTLTVYRSGKTKKIKITLVDQNDLSSSSSSAQDSTQSSDSSGNSSEQGGVYGYGYGNGNGEQSGGNGFGYGY